MRRLLALTIFLTVGLVAACSSSTAPPSTPMATATAAPSEATAAPSDAGTPLADRLEAEIAVEGSPDWPLAAFDSVWVLAPDLPLVDDSATPNLIRSIRPRTRSRPPFPCPTASARASRRAKTRSGHAQTMHSSASIQPRTRSRTRFRSQARIAYRPAAGAGYLWFLGSDDSVADTLIALDTGRSRPGRSSSPGRSVGWPTRSRRSG